MTAKQIRKKLEFIYKSRQKAHDILLKCDIAIDELLKILIK